LIESKVKVEVDQYFKLSQSSDDKP